MSFQGKIPAPVHPMEGNAEKNMTPLVLPLYFCGAAGTSYFFRFFPLLGEIRLTFVDIFILCFFVCYMPSFAIIMAYSFTAHPPLNGVPSPLTRRSRPWKAVICPDLFKCIFTPVSPQFHRRPPSGSPGGCLRKHGVCHGTVSVQAWDLGTNAACQGCPGTLCFQPLTNRSPAEGVLFLSCICHVFVLVLSASFPLNLGGFRRASAGKGTL